MNEHEALTLARRMMDAHGLGHWSVELDHARRRAGSCQHRHRRLTLSRHFLRLNDEAEIRMTVLHEMAHALAGPGQGHGPVWRRICQGLGGDGRRCGDFRMPEGAWVAVCPGCQTRHSRCRRPRTLTGWHCKRCGPQRGPLRFQDSRQ